MTTQARHAGQECPFPDTEPLGMFRHRRGDAIDSDPRSKKERHAGLHEWLSAQVSPQKRLTCEYKKARRLGRARCAERHDEKGSTKKPRQGRDGEAQALQGKRIGKPSRCVMACQCTL